MFWKRNNISEVGPILHTQGNATRAALLTGRNHHSDATGCIMEAGTGFPGYNTLMPKSCGTFAEVLRQKGDLDLALATIQKALQAGPPASGPKAGGS